MVTSVQKIGVQSSGAVTVLSLAFPSNVTAGNSILVGLAAYDVSVDSMPVGGSLTDSLGNSYTMDIGQPFAAGDLCRSTARWSKLNLPSGGPCTVTMDRNGGSVSFFAMSLHEVSGAISFSNGLTNFAHSGLTGLPITRDTGSLSVSGPGIVVSIFDKLDVTPATITQNKTLESEDEDVTDLPFNAQYEIIAGAGSTTHSWTFTDDYWGAASGFYAESGGTVTLMGQIIL